MKNYLLIATAAGILTSCSQAPDWFYDCDRNFSEDPGTHAQCVDARTTKDTPGGNFVELRNDISGSRGEAFGRHDRSPNTGGSSGRNQVLE